MSINPGTRIGSYEIVNAIGAGGMRYGDDAIARVLNKLGRRTGRGKPCF